MAPPPSQSSWPGRHGRHHTLPRRRTRRSSSSSGLADSSDISTRIDRGRTDGRRWPGSRIGWSPSARSRPARHDSASSSRSTGPHVGRGRRLPTPARATISSPPSSRPPDPSLASPVASGRGGAAFVPTYFDPPTTLERDHFRWSARPAAHERITRRGHRASPTSARLRGFPTTTGRHRRAIHSTAISTTCAATPRTSTLAPSSRSPCSTRSRAT